MTAYAIASAGVLASAVVLAFAVALVLALASVLVFLVCHSRRESASASAFVVAVASEISPGFSSMPLTFELKRQLYLELPHTCHFDRPAGAEKPQHFANAYITQEAKWGSLARTGSFSMESTCH